MTRTPRLLILLCLSSISFAQDPTRGLVASYPLDGNASDVSSNGFHGRVIRARPVEDRFGNPNGSLFFDGRSSYVRLGNILNSVFCAPAAKFTITGWAKTQSYPGYPGGGVIISKTAGGNYGPYQWSIDHDMDGKIKWFVSSSSDASDYMLVESNTVPTDHWFHFAAVFDGSQQAPYRMRLSVDGVDGSPSKRIGVLGTSTEETDQEITVGAGHRAGEPFIPNNQYCGSIDDIRIYDRALSVAEINASFHAREWAPEPPPPPTIAAESPVSVTAGDEFWVEINITNFPDSPQIVNIGFDVIYTNTQYVDFVSANAATSVLGPDLMYLASPNETSGKVSVGMTRKETDEDSPDGELLIRLKFRITADTPGNTEVTFVLTNISASDREGTALRFAGRSSTTMIRAAARR